MDNAEDVEKPHIIIKRRDVPHVDSQMLRWEDMMDGPKRLEPEEDKELEEWDIWKIFQEKLKTDSDQEQPQNQSKENKNDLDKLKFKIFKYFLQIISYSFIKIKY